MIAVRGLSRRDQLAHATVPVLLLITPFIVFLRHNAYGLTVESAASVLALALFGVAVGAATIGRRLPAAALNAALVVLLFDIQLDFEVPIDGIGQTTVLAAAFLVLTGLLYLGGPAALYVLQVMAGVALLSTFALPSGRLAWEQGAPQAGDPARPFILHLVLDEQIGVEGVPPDLTEGLDGTLQAFYESRGFRVFGGAYAEYSATSLALGHLLNLAPGQYRPELVRQSEGPFEEVLERSAYFDALGTAGYRISVVQSDHLDVCDASDAVAFCSTYASAKLGILQRSPLPPLARARVVAGAYLELSDVVSEIREIYEGLRSALPGSIAGAAPEWRWSRTRVSPIATSLAFERVQEAAAAGRRGQAVYAHMLMPHFPYAYSSACELLPPGEWLDRFATDAPWLPSKNTAASRALRYGRYAGQARCTLRHVASVLDAIPAGVRDDAIVIVQGDHGSRIARVDPSDRSMHLVSAADYADTYSTLFAVRGAGLPAGYAAGQFSTACLLSALVQGGLGTLAVEGCRVPPAIVMGRPEGGVGPYPLPLFR